MPLERKRIGFGWNLRSGLIAMLAALVLVVPVFSASPTLHKYLHHDANEAHHSCLVCAFAKGQISAADAMPVVVLVLLGLICSCRLDSSFCFPSSDIRLAPSRAPPVR